MKRRNATPVLVLLLSIAVLPALGATLPDDEWIAAIEGGWSGDAAFTPMGPMPMAMLFDRDADGSLHSRSALNRETYIDLRFRKDADGRWMLEEAAGLEGQGEQAYLLEPVATTGPTRRWVAVGQPDFLSVDLAMDGDTMSLDVDLRGRRHTRFSMKRVPQEDLPAMRAALERQAAQSPEEMSIHDLVAERHQEPAGPASEDPIEQARAVAHAHPTDARAQLALANRLSAAIQADPAEGPRYAFELLETLQRTVRLDPTLTDAYQGLVGYYLNAPPIAGGSVGKAEETARQLGHHDPAASEALLAMIERHQASQSSARGSH